MVGEVPPYSVKSGPWELVGGEWTEVPTVLVVMLGGSRIGVHVDTGVMPCHKCSQAAGNEHECTHYSYSNDIGVGDWGHLDVRR